MLKRESRGGGPLIAGFWPPGPTAAFQLFQSTAPGAGAWVLNPTFQSGGVIAHVLPTFVDQDRAYAIAQTYDYDIVLAASTENAFSIVINTNDGANRRSLRYMADARRVGAANVSGQELTPVRINALWTLAIAAVGTSVRFSLTNGSGAASRVSFYAEPLVTPNVAAP